MNAQDSNLPILLVAGRNQAFKSDSLNMKCDRREIPDPIESAASYIKKEPLTIRDVIGAKSNQTRWMAIAGFSGVARRQGDPTSRQTSSFDVAEPVAMTIVETEARLLGIIGPRDPSLPAIWWSWNLSDISVQTEGEQGTFRKRPARITIAAHGASVSLQEVCYVRNDGSSYTAGREGAFLKALRSSA